MTRLSGAVATELTEKYYSHYMDNERVTPQEIQSWQSTLAPDEFAFMQELHNAVAPDDLLLASEIDGFTTVQDYAKRDFKIKCLPRFHYAWLENFATRIDPFKSYHRLSFEERSHINDSMTELDTKILPEPLQFLISAYSIGLYMEAQAPGLNQSKIGAQSMCEQIVELAHDNMELYTLLQNTFGDNKGENRSRIRKFRHEFKQTKNEMQHTAAKLGSLDKDFSKALQTYWQAPELHQIERYYFTR